jgi:tetratricopeptide (TPR) repeat protein
MPGSFSLIGGSRAVPHGIGGRVSWHIGFALLGVFAPVLVLAPVLEGQSTQSMQPKSAILRGNVNDRAGRPVENAQVVLQGKNLPASRETSTNATGAFTFVGIATGQYCLTASSGTLRSAADSVNVSAPGEQPRINLVLGTSGARGSAAAPENSGKAMQFADKPNFSIAAVTDWTAAGGHGSDSILRTSEALTRQAVKLNSDSTKPAMSASPGGAEIPKESESTLRAAVEKDPKGFAANYKLGLFYLQMGRYQDAISPLRAAYQADPANYDNEYDLAQALKMAGDAAQAREHVRRLLAQHQNAALHRIEGELDESMGDPLSAVREFQEAASEDPSEENYFAWGSELLFHRAVWQAKEVFDEGARLYPQSARMLTARGAALFAGALYDDAALDLCRASDLDPQNAEPYLFMGKIEMASPNPLPCVVAKLARFQRLQPANSLANYYYAMALWKQQEHATDTRIMERVKAMLTRAVSLDPKCADGYLQLGNMSAGQKQWGQAVGLYLKAIQANPDLSEAHYRLGLAYERMGEEAKAREQFQLHDATAREQAAEIQRQRKAVKQFLVVLPGQAAEQQSR